MWNIEWRVIYSKIDFQKNNENKILFCSQQFQHDLVFIDIHILHIYQLVLLFFYDSNDISRFLWNSSKYQSWCYLRECSHFTYWLIHLHIIKSFFLTFIYLSWNTVCRILEKLCLIFYKNRLFLMASYFNIIWFLLYTLCSECNFFWHLHQNSKSIWMFTNFIWCL